MFKFFPEILPELNFGEILSLINYIVFAILFIIYFHHNLFFTFMYWRRKWQPTPVFLPGESQGRGSLVGCHLWGRTESDTTEVT